MSKHTVKKVSGIYKITNLVNGKVYIGQSKNCYSRSYKHLKDLLRNKHHNSYLQNAFNKYGRSNFVNQIIERCDEGMLNEREVYWMKHYNSTSRSKGYNLSVIINDRQKMSDETRQIISKISKKWLDNNKPIKVTCSQEEWIENRAKGLVYRLGKWETLHEPAFPKIHNRKIWAVDIETRNITEYESAAQCERKLNIGNALILKCIHGFQKRISTGEMSEKKVFWQVKGFRFFKNNECATEFANSGITKNPTPNRGKSRDSEIILKKDEEIKTFRTFEEVGKFLGMDRFVARYKITKHTHIQDWEIISCKRIK